MSPLNGLITAFGCRHITTWLHRWLCAWFSVQALHIVSFSDVLFEREGCPTITTLNSTPLFLQPWVSLYLDSVYGRHPSLRFILTVWIVLYQLFWSFHMWSSFREVLNALLTTTSVRVLPVTLPSICPLPFLMASKF